MQSSPLRLYNTYTKKEEEFVPIEEGKVRMYTCGPTVYGRPHIGNYSSFLMADLLRRWLQYGLKYEVTHVKNITDVGHLVADADQGEDKVEKQAREEHGEVTHDSVIAIARKYEQMYLEDERALNMVEPEHRPRATETIPRMIAAVEELLQKGHAYETEDGVYFSVESFPDYGKLSGNTLENLSSGARIAVKEQKKHPADFALWKKCTGQNANHVLRWDSPWGPGFPGWHIECSAMATAFLGEQIDIHTGGEDNIFPHHECEIAQSECASGKHPYVRLWLHKRRINMGEEKMSKSIGNVLTIPDIVAMGYSPLDLRYYFLSVHYRTQLKFTEKGMEDARKARRKIMEWIQECNECKQSLQSLPSLQSSKVYTFEQAFRAAMNADLNTPGALAAVFDCMAWSRNEGSIEQCAEFATLIRSVFGCFEPEDTKPIPQAVQALARERAQAREAKDFATSDRLRDAIRALGYDVRDTADGQRLDPSF
ncbi:cysteine--tRNA ligase [Candidatus Peribacteria bacterium]|nr:cysteine--tRNA ligase [Candidatus Peribacteria bacterium]